MIDGYVGRPGCGKTYTLTERALRAANSGRDVFTNFPVAHKRVWLFGPNDLLHLTPGLVIIDEAHLWFPSRKSLQLPTSWLAGLSQTRKNGWDLIWSAQHESRVDRIIRDVTNWMHLCDAWFNVGGHPLLFRTRCWEADFFRSDDRKKRGPTVWSLFNRKVAQAYDTYGRIEVATHAQSSTDPYATAGI